MLDACRTGGGQRPGNEQAYAGAALRIEHAVRLLRTSDQPIERIAEQAGYSDGATLRTLLRKRLGKAVSELRNQPGSAAASAASAVLVDAR